MEEAQRKLAETDAELVVRNTERDAARIELQQAAAQLALLAITARMGVLLADVMVSG